MKKRNALVLVAGVTVVAALFFLPVTSASERVAVRGYVLNGCMHPGCTIGAYYDRIKHESISLWAFGVGGVMVNGTYSVAGR